jgi:hypothetical protein
MCSLVVNGNYNIGCPLIIDFLLAFFVSTGSSVARNRKTFFEVVHETSYIFLISQVVELPVIYSSF